MSEPAIKTATASDDSRLIDALTLAFVADPANRWVWPDPQMYLLHFPKFAKAFGGAAFAHGSAYYVEGYAGAALWLPPNVHPDMEALASLLQSTGSEQAQRDAPGVIEKMGSLSPKRAALVSPTSWCRSGSSWKRTRLGIDAACA